MAASTRTLLCDVCTCLGQTNIATGCCSECREMYCTQCTRQHRNFVATKTHTIVIFDSTQDVSDHVVCDACKETEHIRATYFCGECRKLYCESCKQLHRISDTTSDHDLYDINFAVAKETIQKDNVNFTSDFERFTLSDRSVSDSGSDPTGKIVRMDSVNFTSDFEKFTLSGVCASDSSSASYQDQNDQASYSDFEGFNIKQEKNDISALYSVFQTSDGKLKIGLRKDGMDKLSAKIIGSFSAKISQPKFKLFHHSSDREKGDTNECSFKGCICLKDGRLLLLDQANNKLKMFDKDYKIISTEQTRGFGMGMTKISEDEIAVLVFNIVYFYKITNNKFVLQERNFEIGSDGYGISYNRDRFAVVCGRNSGTPMVKIFTSSGEEIKCFKSFKHEPGDIINVDTDEDRIYVSSLYLGSPLTCISQERQLLLEYDVFGQDIVEFYNCFLVADFINGAIVLLSKDGSYNRTLMKAEKRLCATQYMAFNSEKQQLYVTQFDKFDKNEIAIIQLQSTLT